MIDAFLTDHRFWLLAGCLAGFVVFERQGPSIHAVLGFLAYILAVVLFNLWTFVAFPEVESLESAINSWGLEWEWWSFGLNATLVMYLGFILVFMRWPIHPKDVLAWMVWGTLFIHELWSLVFENYVCNIFISTPGSDVIQGKLEGQSIYACGRIFGEWIVWVPTSVVVLWLIFLVMAHKRAKERTSD